MPGAAGGNRTSASPLLGAGTVFSSQPRPLCCCRNLLSLFRFINPVIAGLSAREISLEPCLTKWQVNCHISPAGSAPRACSFCERGGLAPALPLAAPSSAADPVGIRDHPGDPAGSARPRGDGEEGRRGVLSAGQSGCWRPDAWVVLPAPGMSVVWALVLRPAVVRAREMGPASVCSLGTPCSRCRCVPQFPRLMARLRRAPGSVGARSYTELTSACAQLAAPSGHKPQLYLSHSCS